MRVLMTFLRHCKREMVAMRVFTQSLASLQKNEKILETDESD